jgi:exodeoxyribonuclease-3
VKIISWNINGLRAILSKNFVCDISSLDPDILCLQEIKVNPQQLLALDFLPQLPFKSFHPAERLGYSGTAIFARKTLNLVPFRLDCLGGCNVPHGTFTGQANNAPPQGLPLESPDSLIVPEEGRVQVVDCEKFFLVNVYVPNAGAELGRLGFRHRVWDPYFLSFLGALRAQKAVIVCGDFNVAHQEIDLACPSRNLRSAGFTDEEREGFSRYIFGGFWDVFRKFYPDKPHCYTWWSYRMNARQRNIGWRIDYFLASPEIFSEIKNVEIYPHIMGSDHAPVGIEL